MLFFYVTMFVNALPVLRPIRKLYKREDIQVFDFLCILWTLYYVFIPIMEQEYIYPEAKAIFETQLFYFLFIYCLLGVSILWDKYQGERVSIINITYYIGWIKKLEISKIGYLILIVSMLVTLLFYLPHVSVALRDTSENELSYSESSFYIAWTPVIVFVGSILSLNLNLNIRDGKTNLISIVLFVSFLLMCFFLRRRPMLFQLVIFSLFFYALNRRLISKKLMLYVTPVLLFVFYVLFPFFNIIRVNSLRYDDRRPISSVVDIITYGMDNWSYMKEKARSDTDSRFVNLFDAVYSLADVNPPMELGSLTVSEVDLALPSVINSNKGKGSQGKLERMTKKNTDIADSVLLLSYGEFHVMGGGYAVLLYLMVFFLLSKYEQLFRNRMKLYLVAYFVCLHIIEVTWNCECTYGGYLSWFFASVFLLIIIALMEKTKSICISY